MSSSAEGNILCKKQCCCRRTLKDHRPSTTPYWKNLGQNYKNDYLPIYRYDYCNNKRNSLTHEAESNHHKESKENKTLSEIPQLVRQHHKTVPNLLPEDNILNYFRYYTMYRDAYRTMEHYRNLKLNKDLVKSTSDKPHGLMSLSRQVYQLPKLSDTLKNKSTKPEMIRVARGALPTLSEKLPDNDAPYTSEYQNQYHIPHKLTKERRYVKFRSADSYIV